MGDETYQKYPKWRHHPVLASVMVNTPEQEESDTPDTDGWLDSLAEAVRVRRLMSEPVATPAPTPAPEPTAAVPTPEPVATPTPANDAAPTAEEWR